MSEGPVVARRVVVKGRVQGVFYRDSCAREAHRACVAGWVRNRDDGAVEIVLEGEHEAVDRLLAWVRHGPPHAHVTHVAVEDARPVGTAGFEVR